MWVFECYEVSTGLLKLQTCIYTTFAGSGFNNILKNQNQPLVCDFNVRYDWPI